MGVCIGRALPRDELGIVVDPIEQPLDVERRDAKPRPVRSTVVGYSARQGAAGSLSRGTADMRRLLDNWALAQRLPLRLSVVGEGEASSAERYPPRTAGDKQHKEDTCRARAGRRCHELSAACRGCQSLMPIVLYRRAIELYYS